MGVEYIMDESTFMDFIKDSTPLSAIPEITSVKPGSTTIDGGIQCGISIATAEDGQKRGILGSKWKLTWERIVIEHR